MKLIDKDDLQNQRNQGRIKLVSNDTGSNIVLVNKDDQDISEKTSETNVKQKEEHKNA